MNKIIECTDEYRKEFLDVLRKNNHRYEPKLVTYSTPNNKYNIDYYKWTHPYQGNWEYTEMFTNNILDYLNQILSKNSVVLDVGAQAGILSVAFAKFAGKVISFEPNPAAFEILNKNGEIYKNIVPYNLACSHNDEVLEFHYSDDGLCNGGFALGCEKGVGVTGHVKPIDVYAVNLNNFLNENHKDDISNIKLIKVDAEGHDKEIIKTIYPIINSIKPILMAELYSGSTPSEVNDLIYTIQSINYDIYDIGRDNSGLGNPDKMKKINSINDTIIGELCNLICLPK